MRQLPGRILKCYPRGHKHRMRYKTEKTSKMQTSNALHKSNVKAARLDLRKKNENGVGEWRLS